MQQSPTLEKIIRATLSQCGGSLSLAEFMRLALYHPQEGYYVRSTPKIGRQGDFITAPQLTSLFGELLTLQFVEVWERLHRPAPFFLIEAGPGTGQLACDILRAARIDPSFLAALRYVMVEISPHLRERQQACVAQEIGPEAPVTWLTDLVPLMRQPPSSGVLFANELLDAFPIHLAERTPEGWQEVRVIFEQGRFQLQTEGKAPPEVCAYLDRTGIAWEPGMRAEVPLDGEIWWHNACQCLQSGMLLTLDYGFPERELYHASRAAGTLVGYHNHTVVSDPLQNPGYVDLTSHVNFSGLVRQGEEQRWRLHGFTTQSWFLMGLGLLERLEGIRSRMGTDPTGDPSWEQIKMAAMRLIMPNAMGERFHALALTKGLDTSPLAGFRLNNRNAAF